MIQGAWERFQQKELTDEVLAAYGYGDGGGGPTNEEIETAKRLSKGIPGCPTVRFDTSLSFLERLKANVKDDKRLPKWVGELYLEYHRGTYTSQARNKKHNRESEFLYQNARKPARLISRHLFATDYPEKTLQTLEKLLLCSVHDVISRLSIKEVYEDSEENYYA